MQVAFALPLLLLLAGALCKASAIDEEAVDEQALEEAVDNFLALDEKLALNEPDGSIEELDEYIEESQHPEKKRRRRRRWNFFRFITAPFRLIARIFIPHHHRRHRFGPIIPTKPCHNNNQGNRRRGLHFFGRRSKPWISHPCQPPATPPLAPTPPAPPPPPEETPTTPEETPTTTQERPTTTQETPTTTQETPTTTQETPTTTQETPTKTQETPTKTQETPTTTQETPTAQETPTSPPPPTEQTTTSTPTTTTMTTTTQTPPPPEPILDRLEDPDTEEEED